MFLQVLVACLVLSGASGCAETNVTSVGLQSESVTDKPTLWEKIWQALTVPFKNEETSTPSDDQKNISPTDETGTPGESSWTQEQMSHSETNAAGTKKPTTTDPYDGPHCPAQQSGQIRWPQTLPGVTALVQCPEPSISGHVSRSCLLIKWPIVKAFWGFPNFQGCKKEEEEVKEPVELPWCPHDTGYATLWPETPVNKTATAKCPKNLTTNDDVNATRRCDWATVDSIKTAQWQAADLINCVVSTINASLLIPADEIQQRVDEWVANHSCIGELTTSASGTFEWNTTIVGGVFTASCPHGFILPSKKIVQFMEVGLWLTTTLNNLLKNSTASNLTTKLQQVGKNISDFAENLRDFVANKTAGIIEDIVANNDTQNEFLDGLSDWLGSWKDKLSQLNDKSEGSDDSGAARVRRSEEESASQTDDFFEWLAQEAARLNLPVMLLAFPNVDSATQSLTYDLRGRDPLGITKNDLMRSLTVDTDDSGRFWSAIWQSWNQQQAESVEPPQSHQAYSSPDSDGEMGANTVDWNLKEALNSIEFPDITEIVDAFRNLSKTPSRKCVQVVDGADVIWDQAETWMCRSENATLSQDLDRAMKESKNFGLGSSADLTFIKVIVNLWSLMEQWRNTIPEAILMIVQIVDHLLSLPRPVIPQHFSNLIIKTVENLPNQPLPANVTSVKVITDNIVLAMEQKKKQIARRGIDFSRFDKNPVHFQVGQDTFDGMLFASIKPDEPTEAYPTDTTLSPSNGTNIGSNVFEHKIGTLNQTLEGVDLGSVDEYFYVPESIFRYNQSVNCDAQTGSSSPTNTSMLQFVIYENDQLFRAMDAEVAVTVTEEDTGSQKAEWKVTSRVVSATLGGHCVWGLEHPVVFSLKHHNNVGDDGSRFCVYWDFTERGGSGSWSTDGCRVSTSSRDHTVCECDHLTNYAVIIDIGGQLGMSGLPQEHSVALEIISYTGCSLSLIGLIITIGMLISVRKLREAKTTPTRLMLCLSLIISMTFYLTGIDQTSNPRACAAFACCIHYFTLVALMWMGVEGVYLYRNIVVVAFNPTRHLFKLCFAAAWGIPAVIVGCIAIFDLEAYGNNERCWISDSTVFFAAFLGPAMLIVALNFIVFFMVMWVLFRRPFGARRYTSGKEHREFARRRREIFGIVSITALLGLTWILGSFSLGDAGVRLTSLYLFTIFNSAQGFFIFLFYGLLSFLTTRGVKSPLTGGTPPLTNTAAKLNQFAITTVALNKSILQIQQCRSCSKRKGSAGDSIMTSCSDVQLEFGHDNPSFQPDLLPTKAKQEMLAGDQKQPHAVDQAPCSFVLSAGILNAGNQRRMIYLVKSESNGEAILWAGPQRSKKEEFVLGTGIIFCGKS